MLPGFQATVSMISWFPAPAMAAADRAKPS